MFIWGLNLCDRKPNYERKNTGGLETGTASAKKGLNK